MKHVSFVVWMVLSTLFVSGAYFLNANEIIATESNGSVLAYSTTAGGSIKDSSSTENSALTSLAALRAKDMAQDNYYSHKSPEGLYFYDYFESLNLPSTTPSCENLLLMPSGMAVNSVFEEWENSPMHKSCLDAGHNSYGYYVTEFDPDLNISIYVYIAASL